LVVEGGPGLGRLLRPAVDLHFFLHGDSSKFFMQLVLAMVEQVSDLV
jgi:hypothetical protein